MAFYNAKELLFLNWEIADAGVQYPEIEVFHPSKELFDLEFDLATAGATEGPVVVRPAKELESLEFLQASASVTLENIPLVLRGSKDVGTIDLVSGQIGDDSIEFSFHDQIVLTADFHASPLIADVGIPVSFFDDSIGDPISWEWDFGDFTPVSHDQNPVHNYNIAGTFTVSLKVSDSVSENTIIKTDYITVNIVAGTYTVGGTGTDYPGTTGLDDCITDIPSTINGNYIIDVRGHVTWNTSIIKNFQTYRITLTAATYHNGNPLIGPIITVNTTVQIRSGDVVIEKLHFKNNSIMPTDEFGTLDITIQNCIFENCSISATHFQGTWKYLCNILTSFYAWHEGTGIVIFENNIVVSSLSFRPWNLYCEYDNFVFRNNFAIFNFAGWPLPTNDHMPLAYSNRSTDASAQIIDWRIGSSNNIGNLIVSSDTGPHNMTNNSLPLPFVASATDESPIYNAYKAFDNNSGNSTSIINNTAGTLTIDLGTNIYPVQYAIKANEYAPLTAPKTWTFEASIDGLAWDSLDSVVNQTDWSSSLITFNCDINVEIAYRYFRLNITENNGATDINIWELYIYTSPEFKSVDPQSALYYHIKNENAGVLSNQGVAPIYVITDISGYPIPYYGYYPIGCHTSYFLKKILVLQRYKHVAKRLNDATIPAVYYDKVYGQFNTPGELNLPQSVTFDSTNFFICDHNNNRIIKIDKNYDLISTYNTSDTVGKPIAIIYNNLDLIVIGIYQLRYLRAEKLDTNLNSLLISDNLTPNTLNNFASICIQNSSSYIITGFNLGYYILTDLTSSFSISTRQFITGKPETSYKSPKTHYNSVIKHSNGSYYFNDSRQIFRTDANFVANGNSNKFYKIYSNLFGLKEGLDETLITYSRDDKKVLRFDKNLNFVEEIYTNTGDTLETSAYDVIDFIEYL